MSDMDLPPLDEATRALLKRAAKGGTSAPPGARGRVLARVDTAIGPGGPTAPSGGSPGVSSSPSPSAASWLRRAWPLVASFAVGGAVGASVLRAMTPPAAPLERIVYVPADRPASSPVVSAAILDDPPVATTASSAAPPPKVASSIGPAADVAAERQLLDVARHALDRQDGTAALAATSEHERRFPGGVLAQEREAMGIRALVLLGRTGEGRARAARFRSRFPNSVLLPAIDGIVGPGSTP